MSRFTTQPLLVAPSNAVGATLTTPASPGGFGDWVEVLASAPAALAYAGICVSGASSERELEFQLGVGDVGAEVPIGRFRFGVNLMGVGVSTFLLPLAVNLIPAGARVAMRANARSSTSPAAHLLYYQSPSFDQLTTLQIRYVPSTETDPLSVGATLTPSGTAWANSAYAEITPGLDYLIYLYGIAYRLPTFGGEAEWELDVAIGPAGSEVVIGTLRNTGRLGICMATLPVVYPIDAGRRISARLRKNDTDTGTWNLAALYYGPVTAPFYGTIGDLAWVHWPVRVP